jgi:hypothetical protein
VLVAGKLLEPLWGAIEVSCRVLEKKNVFEKRKMFLKRKKILKRKMLCSMIKSDAF